MKIGVSLGSKNSLKALPARRTPLVSPVPVVPGEIVFAGLCIEAPALNYRELEGVDLKGKVA